MKGEIIISVLKDGTVKIESSKISMANHMTAEAFLRGLQQAIGGEVTVTRKLGAAAHQHEHEHER